MKKSIYLACVLLLTVLWGIWVTSAAHVVDTVRVWSHDGSTVTINRSDLDAYEAAGYTPAPPGDFTISCPATGSSLKKIVLGVGNHSKTSLSATTQPLYGVVDRIVVDANGADTSFALSLQDADGVTLWAKADCNSLALPYSYAVTMAGSNSDHYVGVPVAGALTLQASSLDLVAEVQTLTVSAPATRGSYTLTYNGHTTASVNAVVRIAEVNDPNGGTFKLTFGGQQTSSIAYGSTAAQIKTALEALSTIDTNEVACTGGPLPATPVVVTFQGRLGGQAVGAITLSTNALTATDANDTASYAITVATPGEGLAYNASTANIKSALETLSGVASNDIVAGGSALSSGGPLTFTFRATLGHVSMLRIDKSNLTGPATATFTDTVQGHSALDVLAAAIYYHELPQ